MKTKQQHSSVQLQNPYPFSQQDSRLYFEELSVIKKERKVTSETQALINSN